MGRSKRGSVCLLLGACMIAYAFYLWGGNLWDDAHAGEKADVMLDQALVQMGIAAAVNPMAKTVFIPDRPDDHEPKEGILGVLELPDLELTLPVQSEYGIKNLKTAPCRYRGRDGNLENLVICAHNYSRHFGRLNELEPGNKVYFTYMDGKKITYEVVEALIIAPDDFEAVESGDWDLILFTCTVGGARRVLLHCSQVL